MGECEICGKPSSSLKYIKLEGTILKVCSRCASLGTEVSDSPVVSVNRHKKHEESNLKEEVIVSDYGKKIQSGRQKSGLTQEELANSLNEKLSEIKALETNKRTPTLKLAKRLEKKLKIKLTEREI